jgi:predicted 3-demethylubiquinone-9 3-methyltransferase (glyoxalase superfamily)
VTPILPCVWLDAEAEEAGTFYISTFPGGRIAALSRYPEGSDNPVGKPRGSVLTVEIEIAGQRFTLLNGGRQFAPNPSISFFVHVDTADEADRLFGALAAGGQELMPLGKYPWSERYGWVKDRFGVSWQVITGPAFEAFTIVPCLMFANAQRGRAEEAMSTYTRIFANGRIDSIERYAAGEGAEGTVKHGRFSLDGQLMVAMDSHIEHGFTFDEGLSLQIMCKDQPEIDRFWDALSEGGEPGPCGWLKDRFGLSWQVVPAVITTWLTSPDAAARDRVFHALLAMNKLDVTTLERAFGGA